MQKVLLVLFCLPWFYSNAETVTTPNLINDADTWVQDGLVSSDTCSYSGTLEAGEVCFGHSLTNGNADGGGSILSNSMSLLGGGLDVNTINQGFTMNYGMDVESHSSNVSVLSCSDTTGDCKDIVDLTLILSADNNIIKTYNHFIELDYSGTQTYSFTNTYGTNNYTDIYSQIKIFGVDAGYTNGYYGAIVSNPQFSVTYDTFSIVDSILDLIEEEIINEIIFDDVDIPEFVEIEIDLPDFFDEPLTIEFDPITDFEIELPEMIQEIEVIQVDMSETMEIEIAELEFEIAEVFEDIEIEEIPEPETVEAEPEATEPEPEPEPETTEDQSPGDDATGDEQSQEAEEVTEETNEIEEETETTEVLVADKKSELKQKIANKLMDKNKNLSSDVAQAQTLALMVALSDISLTSYQTISLQDTLSWYQDTQYVDQNMLIDPYSDLFNAAQNYDMNLMENLQY